MNIAAFSNAVVSDITTVWVRTESEHGHVTAHFKGNYKLVLMVRLFLMGVYVRRGSGGGVLVGLRLIQNIAM